MQAISNVQLWGPTNFAPIINHVAGFAHASHGGAGKGRQYFVLLIITDGAITDMANTKQAIVEASHLPLSLIIVGVGNADFSAMEELDGDGGHLADARGQRAERDIVQFVPFRDYARNPALLAREVLAEVPGQVLEYMQKHSIEPGPGPG